MTRLILRPVSAALAVVLLMLGAFPPHGRASSDGLPTTSVRFLKGQLLVASPQIGDPRFARTVIYMVKHDTTGAFGLVVNRVYGSGPMDKFLEGFDINPGDTSGNIRLHYGGPVEPTVGLVLHTADYNGPGTRVVDTRMALTTEMSVLKAIAEGRGPRRSMFVLGYAGWAPGQLEGEIARGDWLSAPADETLIFDDDDDTKWNRATGKAGLKL